MGETNSKHVLTCSDASYGRLVTTLADELRAAAGNQPGWTFDDDVAEYRPEGAATVEARVRPIALPGDRPRYNFAAYAVRETLGTDLDGSRGGAMGRADGGLGLTGRTRTAPPPGRIPSASGPGSRMRAAVSRKHLGGRATGRRGGPDCPHTPVAPKQTNAEARGWQIRIALLLAIPGMPPSFAGGIITALLVRVL